MLKARLEIYVLAWVMTGSHYVVFIKLRLSQYFFVDTGFIEFFLNQFIKPKNVNIFIYTFK
jgi:hypothetical protein